MKRLGAGIMVAIGAVSMGLLGSSACGGSDTNASGGSAGNPSGGGASSSDGGSSSGPSTTNGGGGGSAGGAGGQGGSSPPGDVGVWEDGPGKCPAGMPKRDIMNSDQLAAAARGEDPPYKNDAPATCYFIHDGSYQQDLVILYLLKGGEPDGARRIFVGESRDGVVIHGRGGTDATPGKKIGDLTISNMTFDLGGYDDGDNEFNTMSLYDGKNFTIDHVTFTGDCKTGKQGGHIETNKSENLLVTACLIEKFGRCGTDGGHEDHGIYLAGGKDITVRNNVIRGNSSRGIQLYTQNGDYGTLDRITIENNLIQENGHGDQEDGIVINAAGTGTITNVTIQRNIFLENYFSGIRFVGGKESAIEISKNTFVKNGAGSSSDNRSEINADDPGGNTGTSIVGNIFDVDHSLMNDCYSGMSDGFTFGDNFVHGSIPTGAKGNCIGTEKTGDPMFTGATDFHPTNAAAKAYGAYAP